jgi:hypothetical protein
MATGTYTQSINGNVATGEIKGSVTIAPNCTGTINYTLEYSNAAYEMKLVLVPQTGDIHALFSKTPTLATTMVCKFTRIARLWSTPSASEEEQATAAARRAK